MTDDEVFGFLQGKIKSVWALEALLLLRREQPKVWGLEALVRELRSSEAALGGALEALRSAGFVSVDASGSYAYSPASPALDEIARHIEAAYAARPLAVAKAIMSAPSDKLRIFSDAFKLKDR